ncbi:fumarate hydratase C-terminal domain-containing protein [Candidatus Entotheonella palauensis]|uniref:fumarate hydratase C-terminal domain-containing protein n=1 Tax=Candidatus Entotheonella palauensis TaxID=93172 RepID=UPI000B7D0263|nr:fumarate hydratase C-terminal domain-containing protein [Candidatus Entotheonella palauensis]
MSTPSSQGPRPAVREVHLQLPLTADNVQGLELGDAVFLNGLVFTGREGVYRQIFENGVEPPFDMRNTCNVTFHCSPAVNEPSPGQYNVSAVTATASFRFAKHVPLMIERYGIRAVIGKGGMQEEIYQSAFRQHGAIYLTTVGYGIGAMYGRGIKRVKDVYWKDELGLAQAMWVLEVEKFGPFLVECDIEGNSLFSRANAEVNETFQPLYEGLPQPALKRLGEVSSPTEEML